MIQIQLNLDPDREALFEEAISRLRGVELTDDRADALILADPAAARETALPCLLDRPGDCGLEELAALASARLMPAHEWRFYPSVLPVAQSKERGQLGAPGLLRIHHWVTENLPARQVAFAQVDLAHWFFGALPTRTHILARRAYLHVHLGYPDDGMALLDVATSRPGATSYYSMHLVGSSGAAYADDHRNAHLLLGQDGARALLHEQNTLLGIQNMLAEFVAGLTAERAWSVNLQDSLNALTTLEEAAHV